MTTIKKFDGNPGAPEQSDCVQISICVELVLVDYNYNKCIHKLKHFQLLKYEGLSKSS